MINENATAPYRLISNLVKGGNHSKEENISEGGGVVGLWQLNPLDTPRSTIAHINAIAWLKTVDQKQLKLTYYSSYIRPNPNKKEQISPRIGCPKCKI